MNLSALILALAVGGPTAGPGNKTDKIIPVPTFSVDDYLPMRACRDTRGRPVVAVIHFATGNIEYVYRARFVRRGQAWDVFAVGDKDGGVHLVYP